MLNQEAPYPYNMLLVIFGKPEKVPHTTSDIVAGVRYGLSLLSYEEEEALIMLYQERRSIEEVSNFFNMSEIKVRLLEHKALQRLKSPQILGFIKYGIAGSIQRAKRAEYKRGFRKGVVMGNRALKTRYLTRSFL